MQVPPWQNVWSILAGYFLCQSFEPKFCVSPKLLKLAFTKIILTWAYSALSFIWDSFWVVSMRIFFLHSCGSTRFYSEVTRGLSNSNWRRMESMSYLPFLFIGKVRSMRVSLDLISSCSHCALLLAPDAPSQRFIPALRTAPPRLMQLL